MICSIDKKKKIVKFAIARKRLSKANFHKNNVKKQQIDYLCFIPLNCFNATQIQNIRTLLKSYGYHAAQYTTKALLSKLDKNNLKLNVNDLSGFYLGQMLVITLNLNLTSKQPRDRYYFELNCLNLIHSFINNQNISFASILYLYNTSTSKFLVYQSFSNAFFKAVPNYFNCAVGFPKLYSNIINFISLLLSRIIFLLSLLYLKSIKNI